MFEDILANEHRTLGFAILALVIIARFVLRRYMYQWVWAVLTLLSVVGMGLVIVSINAPPS